MRKRKMYEQFDIVLGKFNIIASLQEGGDLVWVRVWENGAETEFPLAQCEARLPGSQPPGARGIMDYKTVEETE